MMALVYGIVFVFTTRSLAKGYAATRTMMRNIRRDTLESGMTWVRVMLIFSWLFTLFLILFAKVKFRLPPAAALGLILVKLPVLGLMNSYFEKGRYTRLMFAADRVDQASSLGLCGWVFYYYLFL